MKQNEALNSEIKIDEINLRKEKLAEVDEAIKDLRSKIEFAEAIKRLQSNPDYQLVVKEGYLDGEAKRITECLTEPTYLKRDQIENMTDMMSAIRYFKTFMLYRENDALNGEAQIEELEEFRKSINAGTEE